METRQRHRRPRTHREVPHLPGPATKPVAVIGARRILAASAPARRVGIITGMRLRTAHSLCPELTALPPQEEHQARTFETTMKALTSLLVGPVMIRPELALSHIRGPTVWVGEEKPLVSTSVEIVTQEADVEYQIDIVDSLSRAILVAHQGIIVEPE